MTTFTTEDRMEAQRQPRIMVITPTTGKDTLEQAVNSVVNQTVKTEMLLVADGPEAEAATHKVPWKGYQY